MKVLVTGGAGYIGSTVCSNLLDQGHTPIILDSLVTGKEQFTKLPLKLMWSDVMSGIWRVALKKQVSNPDSLR